MIGGVGAFGGATTPPPPPPWATPRYAPRAPLGQVSPLPKESLTNVPHGQPTGTARGGGTLFKIKIKNKQIFAATRNSGHVPLMTSHPENLSL